jgi:protease-4
VASIYELFLSRVDQGRGLDRDGVDKVAQGRVWTGAQAAEVGLVDSLGGLRAAVREGKRRLEIEEDADVALVVFPPPRSLVEQVQDALHGGVAALGIPAALSGLAGEALPWLEAIESGGPLALMPFAIEVR